MKITYFSSSLDVLLYHYVIEISHFLLHFPLMCHFSTNPLAFSHFITSTPLSQLYFFHLLCSHTDIFIYSRSISCIFLHKFTIIQSHAQLLHPNLGLSTMTSHHTEKHLAIFLHKVTVKHSINYIPRH